MFAIVINCNTNYKMTDNIHKKEKICQNIENPVYATDNILDVKTIHRKVINLVTKDKSHISDNDSIASLAFIPANTKSYIFWDIRLANDWLLTGVISWDIDILALYACNNEECIELDFVDRTNSEKSKVSCSNTFYIKDFVALKGLVSLQNIKDNLLNIFAMDFFFFQTAYFNTMGYFTGFSSEAIASTTHFLRFLGYNQNELEPYTISVVFTHPITNSLCQIDKWIDEDYIIRTELVNEKHNFWK